MYKVTHGQALVCSLTKSLCCTPEKLILCYTSTTMKENLFNSDLKE